MTNQSQEKQILAYLKTGKSLTAMQALQMFSSWRLAARISNLRKKGNEIHTKMVEQLSGRRHAKYFMDVEVEESGQTRIN